MEVSDDVPKMVGVSVDPGFPALTDENVSVGTTVSRVTVLSVDVLAALLFVNASWVLFAAIVGMIVPSEEAVAVNVQVVPPSEVETAQVTVAVPALVMSELSNSVAPAPAETGLEKTAVNRTLDPLVGSTWPPAWLTVTVNPAAE